MKEEGDGNDVRYYTKSPNLWVGLLFINKNYGLPSLNIGKCCILYRWWTTSRVLRYIFQLSPICVATWATHMKLIDLIFFNGHVNFVKSPLLPFRLPNDSVGHSRACRGRSGSRNLHPMVCTCEDLKLRLAVQHAKHKTSDSPELNTQELSV